MAIDPFRPSRQYQSTPRLLLRSLLPSSIGLIVYIWGAILFAGTHIALLALRQGHRLPEYLNGQWGTAYTTYIAHPLHSTVHTLLANSTFTLVLWGAGGLGGYLVLEYVFHAMFSLSEVESNIQLTLDRGVVHHPLRKRFFVAALWRGCVVLLAILFLWNVQSLIQAALSFDNQLIVHITLKKTLVRAGESIGTLMLLIHGFVVLLRLYMMRTRVFGDELH